MEKKRTILASGTAVIAVVLLSKVTGFLRQALIGRQFGSNIDTDIYFISTEFLINISGAFTAALTTALVTTYIAIKLKRGQNEANTVASKVLTMFLLFASLLIALVCVAARPLAGILAPNIDDAAHLATLSLYLRIFSAAFMFSAFQSIYAAVLNANNIFVPGMLYGLIFNPLAIAAMLVFSGKLGIPCLIYAYYIANVIQIVYLHLRCRRIFKFRPILTRTDNDDVKNILLLALPLLLSNLVMQLNGIIDKAICSHLGEGVASNYSYANTLEQFVTSTVTATVSLILLSRFAEYVAQNDNAAVCKLLRQANSALIAMMVPIAVIALLSSDEIVTVVYMRGKFDEAAKLSTMAAFSGFIVGLPFVAVREMLIRVHYSYKQTKIPMFVSVGAVALNAALSYILALPLGLGVFGITVATSVSSLFSIVILNRTVKKYVADYRMSALLPLIWRVLLGSAAAGGGVYLCGNLLAGMSPLPLFLCKAAAGGVLYLAVLAVTRCREFYDALGYAVKKIIKVKR